MNKKFGLKRFVYFIVLIAIIFAMGFVFLLLKNNSEFNSEVDSPSDSEIIKKTEPAILYIATMTHLENDWAVDTNKVLFEKVAGQMRYGMTLAEQYKAILTFESGLSFTQGIVNFDDNVMKEALDRGFGVGTHVDLSAREVMTVEEAAQIVKEHVEAVNALVGVENNVTCSGVNSKSDWYTSAKEGGCKAIDGGVGFAYLSMPLKNRPAGWTDAVILREKFHSPAPVGDARFYPFWISDSQDFVEDVDGDILFLSGENLSLAMSAEAGGRNNDSPTCGNDCPLTMEDVTVEINDLKDFAASRDTSKIAKYNFYLPSNLFVPENEEILKEFFLEAQKLVEQGIVKWGSQKDVYEAVVAGREE